MSPSATAKAQMTPVWLGLAAPQPELLKTPGLVIQLLLPASPSYTQILIPCPRKVLPMPHAPRENRPDRFSGETSPVSIPTSPVLHPIAPIPITLYLLRHRQARRIPKLPLACAVTDFIRLLHTQRIVYIVEPNLCLLNIHRRSRRDISISSHLR